MAIKLLCHNVKENAVVFSINGNIHVVQTVEDTVQLYREIEQVIACSLEEEDGN